MFIELYCQVRFLYFEYWLFHTGTHVLTWGLPKIYLNKRAPQSNMGNVAHAEHHLDIHSVF